MKAKYFDHNELKKKFVFKTHVTLKLIYKLNAIILRPLKFVTKSYGHVIQYMQRVMSYSTQKPILQELRPGKIYWG